MSAYRPLFVEVEIPRKPVEIKGIVPMVIASFGHESLTTAALKAMYKRVYGRPDKD